MKTAEIVHVYETKVWVEVDMMGSKHVMIQHQAPGCEPFCYCSFHYNYAYTDNANIRREAERMALAIGATEPVEFREREWTVPNANMTGLAPEKG